MAQLLSGWKATNDMILVEPLTEERKTESGLYIVDKAMKRKPKIGTVRLVDEKLTVIKVGETVMYLHGTGTPVTFTEDGKEKEFELLHVEDLKLYNTGKSE